MPPYNDTKAITIGPVRWVCYLRFFLICRGISDMANIRVSLGIVLLSVCIRSAHAEPIPKESVAFDQPEGWAMAYMTASTLNLGMGPYRPNGAGSWRWSTELSSIPTLNDAQQQVGFGGFKSEDLNKSPVFGRLRVAMELFSKVTAEVAYTPPIEIRGAKAVDVWGVALSRQLLTQQHWTLGARLFVQTGEVRADVTCSAEVAQAPARTPQNPFGCAAPSQDRLSLDHHGIEFMAAATQPILGIEPWLAIALTRMTPTVEVDAPLQNTRERYTLKSKGNTQTISVGLGHALNARWRVDLATSYTPLDVQRPLDRVGGRDDLWNVKLSLTWDG